MPKQVAIWNSARDVWEIPQTEGFFCEHLDVFSETFPTSGMTASGAAYELPTWEPATPGSGYLSSPDAALLPTVTTQDAANNGGPSQFERNTPPLNTRVLMLGTPTAALAGGVQTLEVQVGGRQKFKTLPTPTVSDTNGPGIHGDGGAGLEDNSLTPADTGSAALGGHSGEPSAEEAGPHGCDGSCDSDGERAAGDGRTVTADDSGAAWRGSESEHLSAPTGSASESGKRTGITPDAKGFGRREGWTDQRGSSGDLTLPSASVRIGANTSLPSAAGNEPSDGQLPGQLNLLDAITDNA